MSVRRTLIILLLLLLVPFPLFNGNAELWGLILVDYRWGTKEQPSIVYAGDGVVYLTVTLRALVAENKTWAQYTLSPLEATLEIPEPLRGLNGKNLERISPSLQLSKTRFSDGESFQLSFPVEVPSMTPAGSYGFKLNVSYRIYDADNYVVSKGCEIFTFNLEVRESSPVYIYLKGSAIEGDTSVLTLKVVNGGLEDVQISSIVLTSTFIRLLNPNIGGQVILTPNSSTVFQVGTFVERGTGRKYDRIAVTLQYRSGGKYYSTSQVFNIPIFKTEATENKPSIMLYSKTSSVYGGVPSNITLIVENSGDETARKMKLQVSSQTVSVLGSSLFYLGDLMPGERRNITLEILPSEDQSSYSIILQFTYREFDNGVDAEKQESAQISLGRIQEARVVISSASATYSSGRLRVFGNVANVGDRDAKFVNVTISSGACMGVSTYIGDLKSGESTGFTLSCETARVSKTVGVTVGYLASPGNWKETKRDLTVSGVQVNATGLPGNFTPGGNFTFGNASTRRITAPGPTMNPAYWIVWLAAGLMIGLIAGKIIFRRKEVPQVETT
ncbi:MAG: hypothetical protein NZ992_04655 [Candidatus Korarchaeum sp.]|nr:hypothetical protein [Candidatus Korarchaeum sp.]MDW8035984.1 hypothetical protein [Candidatus Korarchaeum sp.]